MVSVNQTVRKAVILAGGFGTRLMEETDARPKPMVEIGGRPMLWHIMKIYAACGINEFVLPLGYKQFMIKEFFANYRLHMSDVTFDYTRDGDGGEALVHTGRAEPWKVTLVDTGLHTMTGGRLKRLREHVGDAPFCMTYGDGVARLDVQKVIEFHKSHGRLATVTAVHPPSRFGTLDLTPDNQVATFREKPIGGDNWINGGFFVLSPKVLDYIRGDETVFEKEPMERLAADGELMAYKHEGFWFSMDTLRDKKQLEEMWATGDAPWGVKA